MVLHLIETDRGHGADHDPEKERVQNCDEVQHAVEPGCRWGEAEGVDQEVDQPNSQTASSITGTPGANVDRGKSKAYTRERERERRGGGVGGVECATVVSVCVGVCLCGGGRVARVQNIR